MTRPPGRLLRGTLVIAVVLVSGGLLTSGALELFFRYRESVEAIETMQAEMARGAAAKIQQFIADIERTLRAAAQGQDVVVGGLTDAYRFELIKLLKTAPAITEAAAVDEAGRERLRVSRVRPILPEDLTDRSGDPAFLSARAGKTFLGPVYFVRESEPYMTVAIPIEPVGGEILGVLVAEVNLTYVRDVVSGIAVGKAGYAYVVSPAGDLIAHPDLSFVLEKRNLREFGQVQAALAGTPGVLPPQPSLTGEKVLPAFASIPGLGWAVVVERPLAEAYAPLYGSILRTSILVLVGLGVAVLASLLIGRRIVRPVEALRQGAARIGSGDLEYRLDVKTGDELQVLAEEFNRMAARLQESYATLEQRIEERTRELGQKSRELEVASRHKSEFLANMSHELRTPLNSVIGFSEVLRDRMFGDLNPKQTQYVEVILASGRHLLSLINDILDLSKIEAGRMELELAAFDLPLAIQNTLALVSDRAARHGVTITTALDKQLGSLTADERKLKQILLNLLANAVKFTPEGGRIEVAARPSDGHVEISVTDTGIGIAEEDQEAIFEEFRQVGAREGRPREGTGLGLPLAKRFVELHGGRLWVESKVGRGSTFTFTIPRR
jgi:signal transduction histidine kinase